tara:strand:- start:4560 stop:5306 length:747 start_codon:yes stop_codon:yes gene_type:complete
MSETVKGKNILVTGATSGIGLELVKSFASKGANIIMLAKDEGKLDQLYDEISIHGGKNLIIKSDLRELNEKGSIQISHEIENYYKNIDGLIHNAAILGSLTRIEDYQSKTWDEVLQVNLTSSFLITKHILGLVSTSDEARIIFVSSGVSNVGKAFWGAYSVSKFAQRGLVEILSEETEVNKNMKVFSFDPGATRTKMRFAARPSENQDSIKTTKDLVHCFEWFFSDESALSEKVHFKYSDFHPPKDAT